MKFDKKIIYLYQANNNIKITEYYRYETGMQIFRL
jgi:hypothetical protein